MTYAQGGLIEANDYNNLLGAAAGTTGGGTQVNPVWATGYGSYGWGQTALSNVSAGGTVFASEWASLINTVNNATRHESFYPTSMTAPTAGNTITYLSAMTSSISTMATNRNTYNASGSTITLNKTVVAQAAGNEANLASQTWTVTFPSVDQARYFFNAGGNITLSYWASSSFGTPRDNSLITLAQTNFASKSLYATTWGARTGVGGTVLSDITADGFYGVATVDSTYLSIQSTSYYGSDSIAVNAYTSGGAGSYAGNGNVLYISAQTYSSIVGASQPTDTLFCSITFRLSVTYPSTFYLSNSWGTVTIT